MGKSTRETASRKSRPLLWLHASGHWAKKIRKRTYYFGRDLEKATAEYLRVKAALEAGEPAPPLSSATGSTIKDLCNEFFEVKKVQRAEGGITERTLADYEASCLLLLDHFGKHFPLRHVTPKALFTYRKKLKKKRGLHALGNEVNRARVILRFAYENELIDKPIRFGKFRRPTKASFRREREAVGERMLEPAELRKIIRTAGVHLKAMILLGLNAGFGNADIGTLPTSAINLDAGELVYPRPKTGVYRRAPLWRETVKALRRSLKVRPSPKDEAHERLFFVTRCGAPWHLDDGTPQTTITWEFRKVLNKLKLHKKGRSFYTLRHVFQTAAEEAHDETAVRMIMGHADQSMSAVYRERFPVDRLKRVVECVRAWLWPAGWVAADRAAQAEERKKRKESQE